MLPMIKLTLAKRYLFKNSEVDESSNLVEIEHVKLIRKNPMEGGSS